MTRPILFDFYCKAGGASVGYYRAGFDVVGVDIEAQPNYPYEFIQMDALEAIVKYAGDFDAAAASPPCQVHSAMTNGRWQDRLDGHVDLIPDTRRLLIATGKHYIIENVVGAPLINPVLLCGTMFGLKTEYGNPLYRHRLFETSFGLLFSPSCCIHRNDKYAIGVYGGGKNPARQSHYRSAGRTVTGKFGVEQRAAAMGIDWMTGKELNQAIPPAYTEWLGNRMLEAMRA